MITKSERILIIMPDVYDKEKRSEIMKKVKSFGNKSTEQRLIGYFQENKITGWRRHYNVKGRPDFVFMNKKIAIFVDGCFWHGHDCRNTHPSDNKEYWEKKRAGNIQHDIDVTNSMQARGWIVIRIWECELKKKNKPILLEKLKPLLKTMQKDLT